MWNYFSLRITPITVRICRSMTATALAVTLCAAEPAPSKNADQSGRIRPWPVKPWFWCYEGRPILLLGGSKDDNLFQIPDLQAHLEEMASAGANYIRNTMSDRPDGGFEVYPFLQRPDGKYDLDQWNPEYWRRLDNLLRWTHELGIIVQIEVWDRFDYSRAPWRLHPYNPINNINYTCEASGLAPDYPDHPGQNRQPFFFTTPRQRHNKVLLQYQQRFVRELLRHSLPWPHVLYCIDNETSAEEEWASYWADFIRSEANAAARTVCITEMWDAHDLRSPQHARTIAHPERYDFFDASQNNHQIGDEHWNQLQWLRKQLSAHPRPINSVKVYGAATGRYGTDRDGLERWWRMLLGGAAAVRFHRPPSGLGWSPKSAAAIRSARMLEARVPFWDLTPTLERFRDREPNEAFATAAKGRAVVVYFPAAGDVEVDLRDLAGPCTLRWLDTDSATWHEPLTLTGGDWTRVRTPRDGMWVAIIERQPAGTTP